MHEFKITLMFVCSMLSWILTVIVGIGFSVLIGMLNPWLLFGAVPVSIVLLTLGIMLSGWLYDLSLEW